MTMVSVSVMLDDITADRFAEMVALCKSKGLVVEREMIALGVISGLVEASRVADLKNVRGVRYVEETRAVGCLPKPLKL